MKLLSESRRITLDDLMPEHRQVFERQLIRQQELQTNLQSILTQQSAYEKYKQAIKKENE